MPVCAAEFEKLPEFRSGCQCQPRARELRAGDKLQVDYWLRTLFESPIA